MCMRPSPWEWIPSGDSNAGALGKPGAADVHAEVGVPVVLVDDRGRVAVGAAPGEDDADDADDHHHDGGDRPAHRPAATLGAADLGSGLRP